MKKQFFVPTLLTVGLLFCGCTGTTASDTTAIALSDSEITVEGQTISQDTGQAVYLTTQTETHDDVSEDNQDIANTVINITQAGTYQLSGSITDAQIRVTAPEQEVNLILDNASISCQTAPAILFEDAADQQEVGTAGATITLADGSVNQISGSHVAKYTDETGTEIKNDGAISSNVSLQIEGTGELQVSGDKEGIESKLHLTINNGTIGIVSRDDTLNASEDGVSVITINDGILNCAVQNGEEGDGIDSNGYIYINGGFVAAQAHSTSQDSGLDADLGVIINGGTVCATGNMYEEISDESAQQFAQFYFADAQTANTPLVITDADGNYLLAYTPANAFSILEFSSPDLKDGETYYLYSGGTLTGNITNGIYTEVSDYTNGTQLAHRGTSDGTATMSGGRPGGQPPKEAGEEQASDTQRPEPPAQQEATDNPSASGTDAADAEAAPEAPADSVKPEDAPEPPADGAKPDNAPEQPADGTKPDQAPQKPGSNYDLSAQQSIEFTITADSRVFQGVAPYEG